MNISHLTHPSTATRTGRIAGLCTVLAAGATFALGACGGPESKPSTIEQPSYAEHFAALSPEELAAAYGINTPVTLPYYEHFARLSADELAAAYAINAPVTVPVHEHFVGLTAEELAAAYGINARVTIHEQRADAPR